MKLITDETDLRPFFKLFNAGAMAAYEHGRLTPTMVQETVMKIVNDDFELFRQCLLEIDDIDIDIVGRTKAYIMSPQSQIPEHEKLTLCMLLNPELSKIKMDV